jgi:PAS domain S-box-containing protein
MSPFEQIVQQCPDAIVVCDADGVIQFWNRSAEELFGWSATEASGRKPVELFVPPDERREYVASVSEMLTADTAGSPRTMGVWNRDQKRFSVDCRFARVVHDGRELHVGYFHDVSHVVSLETLVARQDLESQILGTATLYSNDEESFEGALRQTLDTLCALTSWPIGHAFLASESDQHLISSPIWSITDGVYEDFCSSRS